MVRSGAVQKFEHALFVVFRLDFKGAKVGIPTGKMFGKSANHVDLEKCCNTITIYLQISASIRARTIPDRFAA